jgi:DNA-directed RNA polymerase specialized sigma24 family protein
MDVQSAREETIRAYQLHAGVLLAYAHRLTRDDALAQDALQETYLRFFLALVQGERYPECTGVAASRGA